MCSYLRKLHTVLGLLFEEKFRLKLLLDRFVERSFETAQLQKDTGKSTNIRMGVSMCPRRQFLL